MRGDHVEWELFTRPDPDEEDPKLVEAIRALPELERTEEQIQMHSFVDRLDRWRRLGAFETIWAET